MIGYWTNHLGIDNMSEQRMSKLQKWIFTNWNIPEVLHCSSISEMEKKNFHSTFWIYQIFFNIKDGKSTFNNYFYQIPNKYIVVVYRSLKNLEKKGLITVPFRGMLGRGHLIFTRTKKGLLLSNQQISAD